MKGLAAIYRQTFRTSISVMLQYRGALVIWLIGQVLEPLVALVVWTVVATGGGGGVGGFTGGELAAYFLILMLVNHTTFTWIMFEFEYRVRQGSLSLQLLRPLHPLHYDVADNVSYKLLTMPVMLVVAGLLSLGFHPTVATSLWAVALFIPSLLLAAALRFLLEWTLALSVFWTTRVSAVNQLYFVITYFTAGQIAPLELFPPVFQTVAYALPFRWTVAFPVELLMGRMDPTQALLGIGAQVVWLAAAYVLMRLLWRAGVRGFQAVGA